MTTVSKALAVLCLHSINTLNSLRPAIKSWTSYTTLPVGISGAMTAYNETSEMITILSPNAPYGKAYMHFYIDSLTFEMLKYPNGYRGEIDLQVTNDFVTIANHMYFIDIFPWNNLNAFSLSTSSFTALNWSLPNGGYSETPCVSKSNDNKYIFILGGSSNHASYDQYFDTFYIYDIDNNKLKGQGTNLPFPASNFGCFVGTNDYLYIIGGEYMPNISKPLEKIQSNEIWSLYIADLSNLQNERWILSNDRLPYSPQHPVVTEVNDLIYIIGGWDIKQQKCSNETNYMVFGHRNVFAIIPGPLLPNALCYTAGITAKYDIYLFGGQTSQDNHGELIKPPIWIKSNYLGPPTLSPTNQTLPPTNSPTTPLPTHSPTTPTLLPTKLPTPLPTQSPTAPLPTTPLPTTPTLSTTQSPTQSPTHWPTHSPTNPPSKPTLSPSHSPTHNAHLRTKHSTEYWVFMAVAIGICVLVLCTASIWLYKKYQRDREKRLIWANDRNRPDAARSDRNRPVVK